MENQAASQASDAQAICQLINRILDNCCNGMGFESGELTVATGMSEITVLTEHMPIRVYVSMTSSGHPVCGGQPDFVSVALLPNGFVLTVNVSSESCTIDWLSRYRPC